MGERGTRIEAEGRRRKGRPKQRWTDSVDVDLRECWEDMKNLDLRRQLVRYIDSI